VTILTRPPNRGVGRFESTPEVQYLHGGMRVRLLADFVYHDSTPRRWIAPKGLVSDGASIPREIWSTIGSPLGGPHFFGALLHDARYRLGDCTKDEADLLLWDACLCGGCTELQARIIAQAVAVAGYSAWNENARKREVCSDMARLLEWA